MIYQRLSKRQLLSMVWWSQDKFRDRDGIICDGSIRSGKTVAMTAGFFMWLSHEFNGYVFAVCGKTIESLRRNMIMHLREWLPDDMQITERRAENKITIRCNGNENTVFLFGGRDESSYSLVQGITLAGVLFDEVALMPRSFVEQAMGRCSVEGSKMWFNCNPEGPEHWFYKEWICKAKERNFLHLHFTMADNLSLSDKIRERYEMMFTGVFYKRYILGEWCVAEGLVYDFFGEDQITDDKPKYGEYCISVDYGTLNPFSAGLWCWDGEKATRVDEYYYSGRDEKSQKTDEEYYAELEKLAGNHDIYRVIVDPSAASFIECIRRHGRFSVRKANNDVLDGIRITSRLLKGGYVKIHRDCKDCIREFRLYRWDEKQTSDKPIKENDHAMDETRYYCATMLKRLVRGIE